MSYEVKVEQRQRTDTAEVHATCSWQTIAEVLPAIYGDVLAYLQDSGVGTTGIAFARYRPRAEEIEVEAGFSTPSPVAASGRVTPGELPGGDCAVCLHAGPYDRVSEAYEALWGWLKGSGRRAAGDAFEVYLSPPEEDSPRAEVILPLETR